jgi:hypothetical protein
MLYFDARRGVLTLLNLKEFFGLNIYISALDQFLIHFDGEHPKLSASQRKEKEKYARIYKLRDDKNASLPPKEEFWDKF